MRITELTALHLRIPLTSEIRHASKARTRNETLLVRCTLDDGTVGWGEGLPRTYVTGETIDSAFDQFREVDWINEVGASAQTLGEAIHLAEDFRLPHASGKRDCFGNALRCAVELSILDAMLQVLGVPLSKAVEHYAPAKDVAESSPRARYSAVLTHIKKSRKQFFWSAVVRAWNVPHLKIKVGSPDQDNARTVKWSRRGAGRKRDIRLDVNEAWTPETLRAELDPMLKYRISSVEQPVPHDQVGGLAAHRGQIGTKIMLDESLCSESDGQRAIDEGLCDLYNIRLSKCGGFLQSLRLAAMANANGLGYQLGCQVGETGLLSAAGRHFACSVKNVRYAEGSFDRWLLHDPLIEEDLRFGYGGWASELTAPGLGVTVNEESVKTYLVREHPVAIR